MQSYSGTRDSHVKFQSSEIIILQHTKAFIIMCFHCCGYSLGKYHNMDVMVKCPHAFVQFLYLKHEMSIFFHMHERVNC